MPNNNNSRCVIVFVKVPHKSQVKTRLTQFLDSKIVVNIYKNFVADILGMLNQSPYRIIVGYYPHHARPEAEMWLGPDHTMIPQQGDDLGQRMANAFNTVFSKGYRHALLMGTDFPDLPKSIVDEAFNSFVDNDAVIGPALDGGYYLIGFKSTTFLPRIFDDIPWGSKDVFEITATIFQNYNSKFHVLPPWRDIDTYEDLHFFIKTLQGKPPIAAKTAAYLSSIKLKANKKV